jgi:sialate O-acetylesterase
MIKLDPMKANSRGQDLKVTALSTSAILKDILIGDVWLASGQSNMGFSIPKSTHAEEARKLIPHPTLRRFKVGPYIADEPLADIGANGAFQNPHWRRGDDGKWRTVDNERFGLDWISAVAAWFGHEIRISQGVPVGIIESHFGGSKLYCWMPRKSLENSPEFIRDIIEPYRDQKKKWDEAHAAWEDDPNRDPNRPPHRTMEALLPLQCDDCTHRTLFHARSNLVPGRVKSGTGRTIPQTTTDHGKRVAKNLSAK